MYLESAIVHRRDEVAEGIFTLAFLSERIAASVRPGQFLNIRPHTLFDPFLRRAYSVHRISGDEVEIIFNVVGRGSALLAAKAPGDDLDVLGPLGVPFHTDGDYRRAVLVSGGVGIAPMPILSAHLQSLGIEVTNIHGARSLRQIVDDGRLLNPIFATEDGSRGFHGNVVQALDDTLSTTSIDSMRLFACGPNRMLSALGDVAERRGIPLEVSLECQMACGVGICQGCPVEMANGGRRYSLVCTHGPNYDFTDIRLESMPDVH